MRTLALAVSAAVLLAAAPVAAQQFYRYVDADGHVRFTDNINQVPETQRSGARSYAESRSVPPPANDAAESADSKAAAAAPAEPAAAAADADETRTALENTKRQVEAEYQNLLKLKDALAKEKDASKTREQVTDYNKRVEAFNQAAAAYEAKSTELRKAVEDYNARIMEENAKSVKSAHK